ncbi:MAG: GatB/YqeY domain-containing protein [Bacteroidetes bacterium]|nr:GatB/YqeY domain-containing protein [Bacteroidota bacterium]
MSLKKRIEEDLKKAMLAKEKTKTITLRAIKSMILLAETEKGRTGNLKTDQENNLLMKAAKQRKDSAEVFKSQNREDLYVKEMAELDIISQYLPEQMNPKDLEIELKSIIRQVGAEGSKDMGKVMGMATKTLAGKADGKTIARMVKSLLG